MRSLPVGAMSLAMLAFVHSTAAAAIYVDDSAQSGANNGTSWDDAFVDLQDALAMAAAGDEIRIAKGLYKPADAPGNRSATFTLVSGATIQGGYAGLESSTGNPDALDPNNFPTILSGDLAGNDGPNFANYTENALHVVTAAGISASTELRGVIIRAGSADDFDITSDGVGAGILATGGTLLTHQCTLEDNLAYFGGAGASCTNAGSECIIHMQQCIVRRNRNISPTGGSVGVAAGSGSTFFDCVFEQNVAVVASSAAALGGGNLTITSCSFLNNHAGEDGAAIFGGNLSVSGCQFINNHSGYWGTVVLSGGQSDFADCDFQSNSSGVQGGAIMVRQAAHATITDCTFNSNIASIGGAVNVDGTADFVLCTFDGNQTYDNNGYNGGALAIGGSSNVLNCAFRSNFAEFGGGAISNSGTLAAVNCWFTGNTTDGPGSALFAYVNAKLTAITNCTVVGNSAAVAAAISAGEGALHVNNSIVWDNDNAGQVNESSQILFADNQVKLNNNCIDGWTGSLGGENNFGDNPQFIDADGPDNIYGTEDDNSRLIETSPCVDSGNNALLPNDQLDLDGDGDAAEFIPWDLDRGDRIRGGDVDRGAFEHPQSCSADISPSGGDGAVDEHDLQLVIDSWGECDPGECVADISPPGGDGTVDVNDLLAVINAWGECG